MLRIGGTIPKISPAISVESFRSKIHVLFAYTRGWDWCPYLGILNFTSPNQISVGYCIPFLVGWCETERDIETNPCTQKIQEWVIRLWFDGDSRREHGGHPTDRSYDGMVPQGWESELRMVRTPSGLLDWSWAVNRGSITDWFLYHLIWGSNLLQEFCR